jgi:DNA invertase Pin-like site-specific DNA recombinase
LDGAGPPRTDKNDEDENCDERVHRRLHAGWPRVDSILSGGASESAQGGLNVASRGTPLIADSKPGDVLLIEQVDRLSRLTDSDWRKLRAELDAKQIRVVALDLPTSWQLAALADDFTARVFAAINAMMLDTLAAVARKDYDDRRRRQTQGIAKAKAEGKYRGRREDTARHAGIASMLRAVRHTPQFRPRSDAAERRSLRSPSEWCRQPSTGAPAAGGHSPTRPLPPASRRSRWPSLGFVRPPRARAARQPLHNRIESAR